MKRRDILHRIIDVLILIRKTGLSLKGSIESACALVDGKYISRQFFINIYIIV